nr:MAG TPA: hypothetical protein [Caudoviricetes sp.]
MAKGTKKYILKKWCILRNGKTDRHETEFDDIQQGLQWVEIFRETYADLRRRGIIQNYGIELVESKERK